jgi:flagellum-specific peptidoglycan hydrolase FlgJ
VKVFFKVLLFLTFYFFLEEQQQPVESNKVEKKMKKQKKHQQEEEEPQQQEEQAEENNDDEDYESFANKMSEEQKDMVKQQILDHLMGLGKPNKAPKKKALRAPLRKMNN